MKHVRLTISAVGREAEVHPVYDVLANAPFVERATAMHWNFTGEELGMMHYVEGDVDAFREAVESIPEVLGFELTPAGEEAFYAYVVGATNRPIRELFEPLDRDPVVLIPPLEYHEDGSVSYSVFGPSAAIQEAIDAIPDPVEVSVDGVGGMATVPGAVEVILSSRQREAVETALELGYYEIPREAGHEAVAEVMGCAPSTAAEHLRKAEAKLLHSVLGG